MMKLQSHARHDVFLSLLLHISFFLLHYIVSTNQPTLSSTTPPVINNHDSSSIKTINDVKKVLDIVVIIVKEVQHHGHHQVYQQLQIKRNRRASINITSNIIEEIFPTNQTLNSSNEIIPFPSISADIDSKSNTNNRQLNPKTLKLDLQNSMNSQTTPNHQRSSTYLLMLHVNHQVVIQKILMKLNIINLSRQRRRRNINLNNNKIYSPSSATIRSIKSTPNTPQIDEVDNNHNH